MDARQACLIAYSSYMASWEEYDLVALCSPCNSPIPKPATFFGTTHSLAFSYMTPVVCAFTSDLLGVWPVSDATNRSGLFQSVLRSAPKNEDLNSRSLPYSWTGIQADSKASCHTITEVALTSTSARTNTNPSCHALPVMSSKYSQPPTISTPTK